MSFLKQYRLQLRTLSPVFIGSGMSLSKKEYIFISKARQVLFVDLHKFFNLLESKRLFKAYEDFVMSGQKDLYVWLMSQKITQDEIQSIKSYAIHAGNAMVTASGTNLTEIQLFVKDNYNHPYIPGSSLKGLIRTAILAAITEKKDYGSQCLNYSNQIREKSGKKILNQEAEGIETDCLNILNLQDKQGRAIFQSNDVNSIMKGIQVSDSRPLAQDCLTVCAKVDYGTNGLPKSINTARECIKPGITIEHTLTLDTQILAAGKMDENTILNSICDFYAMQNQHFLSKFAAVKAMDVSTSNGCELFLGGGTGFVSKTIVYPMLKEKGLSLTAQLMQKQFPDHFHVKDIEKGVSPHMLKCTKYDGKIYLMGRCEVSIL